MIHEYSPPQEKISAIESDEASRRKEARPRLQKMCKRAVRYEEEQNDRGDSVEALSRRRRQECLHRE